MLFIHAQLSSYAKQAVVISSIVATLLCMIMCGIVAEPSFRHILNSEISQFSQHLGAAPASGIAN